MGGCEPGRDRLEMLFPLRCKFRSEVRAVRACRSDKEEKLLNSRLRSVSEEVSLDGGTGASDVSWLVPAERLDRLGNLEAIRQMPSQARRVSSKPSSLTCLKASSAPSSSSLEIASKRFPLDKS